MNSAPMKVSPMRSLAVLLCVLVVSGCARGTGSPLLPVGQPFAASTNGSFGYKVIFNFDQSTGAGPYGTLANVKGKLYGTTLGGGAHSDGTVFTLTAAGAERVLYSFKGGSDGMSPLYGALTRLNGVLYGTTSRGGPSDDGTVFRITTGGAEKVLYAFKGGKDGNFPMAGLTSVGGALYGTTSEGGPNNDGTVFKMSTAGAERILHAFRGGKDGANPAAGLVDVGGTLYGTTRFGGASNNGTVFKIATSGKEKVIHAFAGTAGHDGANPLAGLTDVNGTLYGTTSYAGLASSSAPGSGTVFKITTSGREQLLHTFTGAPDGANPGYGNLALVGHTLYGTTQNGGTTIGVTGAGTVYKVALSGSDEVLHDFMAGNDGYNPQAVTYASGKLFGTTGMGGKGYEGTAYTLRP
jgi:uncharacterized repeat protein (TIGR03803 family)